MSRVIVHPDAIGWQADDVSPSIVPFPGDNKLNLIICNDAELQVLRACVELASDDPPVEYIESIGQWLGALREPRAATIVESPPTPLTDPRD